MNMQVNYAELGRDGYFYLPSSLRMRHKRLATLPCTRSELPGTCVQFSVSCSGVREGEREERNLVNIYPSVCILFNLTKMRWQAGQLLLCAVAATVYGDDGEYSALKL